MSLAVASSSSNSANDSATVVVTAPTGIQTGDLLLIVATPVDDFTGSRGVITSTGFTAQEDFFIDGTDVDTSVQILSKVAVLADESAVNYTVSCNRNMGVATILRITGWQSTNATLNPVIGSDTDAVNSSGTSETLSGTGLTLRRNSSTLVLLFASVLSDSHAITPSNLTITSGVANPTWNLIVNDTAQNGGGTSENSLVLYYATTTDTSDITGWSVDLTESSMADNGIWLAGIATILEPENVTADLDHTEATPSVRGVTASQINTNVDLGRVVSEVEVRGVTGQATAPQQWTNESKPSTTWTNEQK